jgi:hypothetical protein
VDQPAKIDLRTPLSWRASFKFPLQSAVARREVLWGAVLLLVLPGVGWLLNMGHRIAFVRHMQDGKDPFPAWSDPGRPWTEVYAELLYDGLVTFVAMLGYHLPGGILMALGRAMDSAAMLWGGIALWIAGTVLVPGFMTHYCKEKNPRALFDVRVVLRRVREAEGRYWHAWRITLAAMALSFLGLAALGVGFLLTSVWFWQVAGFSFATVFSQRFGLVIAGAPLCPPCPTDRE